MKVTAKLRPHLVSVPTSDAGLIAAARRGPHDEIRFAFLGPEAAKPGFSFALLPMRFPMRLSGKQNPTQVFDFSGASRHQTPQPKRTLVEHIGMSALCQKQTKCVAAKSLYWITSSAATRKVCGTVRPSSLAVLRLMVSKYFTGICTGSPDGFAPRRILST